jgi:hypothetical protein
MELYVLDSDFRRTEVIDKFESLVWTERFQSYGDFELYIYPTQKVKNLITQGTRLICNKSNRIMVVDQIENKIETDGKKILIVKGTSLEKILQDRVASYKLAGTSYIEKGQVEVSAAYAFLTSPTSWVHNFVTGDEVFFTTTNTLPARILLDQSLGTTNPQQITNFDITNNNFRYNLHGLQTGDKIYFKVFSGTIPPGLSAGTLYYLIVVDQNLLAVATSKSNALNGIKVDITGGGSSPNLNIYLALEPYTSYFINVTGTTTFKIALTYEDAINENPISEVYAGSGTHKIYHRHNGKWRITGTKATLINQIFNKFCVDGFLDSTDIIPNYASGDIYTPSNIAVDDQTSITLDINTDTVYNVIKQLAEVFGLGFRITRNYENKQIQFNVYSGNNRTLSQYILPAVVFDKNLESLINETDFTSIRNYKNVAYVFAPNGYRTVYSNSATSSTSGFNKNVLYVDASDIDTPSGITLNTQLDQRGQEMLTKYKTLTAFDGEINNSYIYDKDYMLGDLVEVRNSDGYTNIKRVTEQIFSDDIEGEKSYPTLSSELVFSSGSWLYYNNQTTWTGATTGISDTITWSNIT